MEKDNNIAHLEKIVKDIHLNARQIAKSQKANKIKITNALIADGVARPQQQREMFKLPRLEETEPIPSERNGSEGRIVSMRRIRHNPCFAERDWNISKQVRQELKQNAHQK